MTIPLPPALKRSIKRSLKTVFNSVGLDIHRRDPDMPDAWDHSPQFRELYRQIESRTLVTPDRCFMVYQFAKRAASLDGDIAEVGVYKGGTALLEAKACPEKTIHIFDTFAGMPGVDETVDHHRSGDFADTSLEGVQRFLQDCPNVKFHPGFFPGTAGDVEGNRFAFVYIDTDIYQSIKDCLEFFYERLTPGGVILLDDYEWRNCAGVKKAVDEFLTGKREGPLVTAKYQCAILKACR